MGCNCGKNKAKQVFVYTDTNGKAKEYPTEIEARAAVIRNRGGEVKVVTR